MNANINLTDEEKLRLAKLGESGLSKFMFGLGLGLKATAWAAKNGTKAAATLMRSGADGVESAGAWSSEKLVAGADYCSRSSKEHEENAKLLGKALASQD